MFKYSTKVQHPLIYVLTNINGQKYILSMQILKATSTCRFLKLI